MFPMMGSFHCPGGHFSVDEYLLMLLVLDDPLLLHTNSMLSTINNKRNKIVNRAAEGEGI